jgi:hypothetical protein
VVALGYSERSLTAIFNAAVARRWRQEVQDYTALLDAQWDRDVITLEEYEQQLALYYADPNEVARRVASANLRKFHKVYYATPTETAKAAVTFWRSLYVGGQISTDEYLTHLMYAGLQPSVIDAQARYDSYRRGEAAHADYKQYALPEMRDRYLDGQLSDAAYADALRAAGIPAELLAAEVDYARALRQKKQTAKVRSDQLPAYEQAYQLQLVTEDQLRAAMLASGLSPAAVEIRMKVAKQRLFAWQASQAEKARKAEVSEAV